MKRGATQRRKRPTVYVIIRELASRKTDFAFESTLSGRSYVNLLCSLRTKGYRIHLFFLMRTRNKKTTAVPAIAIAGEKALRAAVAEVVAEHKRTGRPLAVWQDGNAVLLPADRAVAVVREARAEYGTKGGK